MVNENWLDWFKRSVSKMDHSVFSIVRVVPLGFIIIDERCKLLIC